MDITARISQIKDRNVFLLFWLLTFVIYLPAIKAGWVIDAAGWLYNIRNMEFWDYINRKQSGIPSLYQFTQFITWVFYKVFGANPYAWHTLQVTMHAVNAYLLYLLFSRIFTHSAIKHAKLLAFLPVLLYTCSPHLTEIIVWEASYHYLQGFLFILLILNWTVQYLQKPQTKLAVYSGLVFFISTWSLEVFYMTPFLVLFIALYYRYTLGYSATAFRKTVFAMLIPQLVFFAAHLIVLRMVYAHFAHIAENVVQPLTYYLGKPPLYLFHVLFFGRFFPQNIRDVVYHTVESVPGLVVTYALFITFIAIILYKYRRERLQSGLFLLFAGCTAVTLAILMPLAFPYIMLLFYDRYAYFFTVFLFGLLIIVVHRSMPGKVALTLFAAYLGINLFFTFKLNTYWKHSTYVDNRLLNNLPPAGDKTVILLALPENMMGIPMIGAQPEGEYKAMRRLFTGDTSNTRIYDVASFNMTSLNDGAHVQPLNDTTIRVTLNQWGTWWWYEGHGGRSYETPDYRVDMRDVGHMYELTIRKPADSFLLLYQAGSIWKVADMHDPNEQY